MKSKAKNLIQKRDSLSSNITKYWNIIYVENVVNRNYTRNYDLKQLYSEILEMGQKRAMAKLKTLCINMGIKNLKDLSKDNIQYDIFYLSELKEVKVKLMKLRKEHTINPKLKASKGKKNLSKTEVLTFNWVSARIKDMDLEITELNRKLEEFNENAEFEDDDLTTAA